MQLIKDMQLKFTHASIMGQCATRGSRERLVQNLLVERQTLDPPERHWFFRILNLFLHLASLAIPCK